MSKEFVYTCDTCKKHRSSADGDIGVEWREVIIGDLDLRGPERFHACSTTCTIRLFIRLANNLQRNGD